MKQVKRIVSAGALLDILRAVDVKRLFDESPASCADFILLKKDLEDYARGRKALHNDTILITDIPQL